MNRIHQLFARKQSEVLSVFYTAGFPALHDTITILKALEDSGADIVEIGMPYSDPMADGPVIQESNTVAIKNGMTISLLFQQLKDFRKTVKIPVVLMGYLNPVIQYGVEEFILQASQSGIDGLIIPDLPVIEYEKKYKHLFEQHHLSNIFLATPQTTPQRLWKLDQLSSGFIYIVSSNSITGNTISNLSASNEYFERIKTTPLKNPKLIGFNIKDHASFSNACDYAQGAIVGSAFIHCLSNSKDLPNDIHAFIQSVRGETVLA